MPTPEKGEAHSRAMERLEKIVGQVDNDELGIGMLAEKVEEANEIITFYSGRLIKADRGIEKLLIRKRECKE